MSEITIPDPVFIVGPLRSGTTLLTLILNNHQNMNFFGEFEGAVSQAVNNNFPELKKYYSFVKEDRMMQGSKLTVDYSLSYEDLIRDFLVQKYNTKPVSVIGACIHSRFDLITRIWPNAKFIHITRDPRDVARSTIAMGWAGNTYGGAKYWLEPELRWNKLKPTLNKSSFIEVKYEVLVKSPECELIKICNFLGQQFYKDMLDIGKVSSYSEPNAELAEQWRKKQSPEEILDVEFQCQELMINNGYKLQNPPSALKPTFLYILNKKIKNKKNVVVFRIKRYGLLNWLYQVTSARIPWLKNKKMTEHKNNIERLYLK